MGWLQDALDELRGPIAPVVTRVSVKAIPEIKEIWFQTSSPRNGDCGAVEPAFYSVADGVLMMHDVDGKPTGKEYYLGPNDDACTVAGRLAKEDWHKSLGESDFNRPLHYSATYI